MKVYRLYSVNGYAGDPYYHIEDERTCGYFLNREKAESQPEYQEYLKYEEDQHIKWESMTDEEKSEYNEEDFFGEEPYYVAIEEIDVIA
jgi:hypothetical protein